MGWSVLKREKNIKMEREKKKIEDERSYMEMYSFMEKIQLHISDLAGLE